MSQQDGRILTVPEEVKEYHRRLVTGNEWVSLPDIDPRTAGIKSINLLHMALGGLWEFLGGERQALLAPVFTVDGQEITLEGRVEWEYEAGWLPRGRLFAAAPGLDLSIEILTPPGARGFLIRMKADNHADRRREIGLGLRGLWAGCRRTVYTSRRIDARLYCYGDRWTGGPVCEAAAGAAGAAFAVAPRQPAEKSWAAVPAADGLDPEPAWGETPVQAAGEDGIAYRVASPLVLGPGTSADAVFAAGVGKDGDGARTSAIDLLRHGWDYWYGEAYAKWAGSWTSRIPGARSGAPHGNNPDRDLAEVCQRNALFNYYYSRGYTIDTEDLVLVTSRSPHYYVSAAFWARDALLWSLPGLLLVDRESAREAVVAAFTRYLKHAGIHSLYMDGTLLYPGFELDELCAYPIAVETYISITGDRTILDLPAITEGLRYIERALMVHRHPDEWLFDTFLLPSDDPAVYPFVCYDNVLAWRALRFSGRTGEAEAVRAAIYRHLVVEGPFGPQFAWSTDLQGHHQLYDEPPGSLTLLAHYGFCPPDDPVYRHTLAWVHSSHNPDYFAGDFAAPGSPHARHPWVLALANDLLSPDEELVQKAARAIARAAMDNGLACESIDSATGQVTTGEAFATCAGFLAYALTQTRLSW